MFRSIAIRSIVVLAAVACSFAVSRAETLSPLAKASPATSGLLGSFGVTTADHSTPEASAAVLREFAAGETVAYHAAVTAPTFGSQVVRTASGMGFGFDTVPFESFLSVAAAPNGENVIRTFIIIKAEKSESTEPSLGKNSPEELMNRFTQASVNSTTTSGSATLSILQVPPASSSLVFTNVLVKNGVPSVE